MRESVAYIRPCPGTDPDASVECSPLRAPASKSARNRLLAFGSVLAVTLSLSLVGCVSTAKRPPLPPAPSPATPVKPALSSEQREQLFEELAGLLFSAREQARLGLIDEAAESFDQAAARLEPLASRDEGIARLLSEVELEREDWLAAADEIAERFDETSMESRDEELLEGPEPTLDPRHVGEVEEAAQDVSPDWPVDLNDRVLAWLEVYRDGGKLGEYMAASLARSGQYEERFREIFAEEGIPSDLIYLAHVESGFKTTAYSRARARGIFQFISATGRRYGMRVDWWVDERADPETSCRASATYLRDLYAEFGDWKLALAAYNAGEGRVRRSIRKAGTRDFWTLSRRHFFRRETRNYIPAIMAATIISKDPARFGHGAVVKSSPIPYELATVPDQVDLEVVARVTGVSVKLLRQLNPALRRGQTPPKYPNYQLKLPVGQAADFGERLAQVPKSKWIVKQLHRVRRGDTLSTIARRYGTSVRAIQLANGMGRRTMLSIGRVLEIPKGPGPRGSYRHPPMRVAGDGAYRVRRGDTLGRIARRQGVSVAQLQAWNGLGRSTRIRVGERLYLRKPGARVAARAKRAGAATPASAGSAHVIRRGETAWKISRRYGVTLGALLRANGLNKRSILRPGQRLTIPRVRGATPRAASSRAVPNGSQAVHVVRRGESLYKIARRYGVTVKRLRILNSLAPGAIIHPGDRLSVQ